MSKTTLEHIYQEANLDTVIHYFAKDFQLQPGTELLEVEYYVDPFKKKVIYKLFVKKHPDPPQPTPPTPPDANVTGPLY
jgi:hypothetical protein